MIKTDVLEDLGRDAESMEAAQFNEHTLNTKSSGKNKEDNVKENIHPENLKGMKKRADDGATKKKKKTNIKEGIGKKIRKERKRDKKPKKIKMIKKLKKVLQIKGSKSTIKANKKRGSKSRKIIKDLKETKKSCSCDADKRFLTLSNKLKQARLITRTYNALESKKNKSATTFEEAAVAIKQATDTGKKCNGRPISEYQSASTAYKILQTCKSTAAASCDASKIQSITNKTFFDGCIQEFTSFSKGYQVRMVNIKSSSQTCNVRSI